MTSYIWYDELKKPPWAPRAEIFGPVWLFLYSIIALTYIRVGYLFILGIIPFAVFVPFILNIIYNLAFTPILFRMKSLRLAAIDIILVLGTLVWALGAIYAFSPVIVYANVPYLIWAIFATVLQFTITGMNWRWRPSQRSDKKTIHP